MGGMAQGSSILKVTAEGNAGGRTVGDIGVAALGDMGGGGEETLSLSIKPSLSHSKLPWRLRGMAEGLASLPLFCQRSLCKQ